MTVYLYDGSFEGLMTAVLAALRQNDHGARIAPESNGETTLFDEKIAIAAQSEDCDRLVRWISSALSPEVTARICLAFLSEIEGMETDIVRYLEKGRETGSGFHLALGDEAVLRVHRLVHKVTKERHRMMGLVRFSQLESGALYAPIEPDHNIAGLLAPHFARRMPEEDWIIHDRRRNIAAIYRRSAKRWDIHQAEVSGEPEFSEDEAAYRELWRQYCAGMAIPGRKNLKLQRQFMPRRYWKYLTEKGGTYPPT